MQQVFPGRNRSREPLLRRLDRAAGQINPLLLMIAIGLAILNVSCLITLWDSGALRVHLSPPAPDSYAPAADAASR